MRLEDLKRCYVQPGSPTTIDFITPDGLTAIYRQTLEQVQERYPGAYEVDFAEWSATKEQNLTSAPAVEIDAERFHYYLNVLPPKRWFGGGANNGTESFEMIEHFSGNVTSCLVRIGLKHYEFLGVAGMPHAEKVAKCKAVAK